MGGLLTPQRQLLVPSRRAFLGGLIGAAGLIAVTPASVTLLHGAASGGGGSFIPIANATALFAMLDAGVSASGGKSYRLAAGDFGNLGIYSYDFSSNPIVISGQNTAGQTTAGWAEFSGSTGMTWANITFTGHNDSLSGSSVSVHDGGPTQLTFNNIVSDSGNPQGTQTGGGWLLRNLVNSTIVINGQSTFGQNDVQGRTYGVAIIDSGAGGSIVINGLTMDNIGINSILAAAGQNVTINACLFMNNYYGPGDHPNAIHFFGDGATPSQNITCTNNGVWQGLFGGGPAGLFNEGVVNVLNRNNWVLSGGQNNAFSNSAGSGQTNDNNFAQGIVTTGGDMIARGGAVNSVNTNNTVNVLTNYPADGVNPGYVPASPPGSNTIIPAASSVTDFAYLNPWLALHPTARRLN
jgi:hypothetical protein